MDIKELRERIAFRCQVVQTLKIAGMDDDCRCENIEWQYSYQCECLDNDLTEKRKLEEEKNNELDHD